MEKAFEHIGIYDFWGIFWAGIINLTTWVIAFVMTTTSSFDIIISAIDTHIWLFIIAYIVLGYFLGSLLHELGRLCKDKTKILGQDAIRYYLNSNDINRYAKQEIIKIIKRDIKNTDIDFDNLGTKECKFVYDYCNIYLKRYNLNSRSDKTQSIYGFSRGVFVGHALFSLIYFIILIVYQLFTIQTIILLIITITSTLLFWNRTRIYNVNRVKNILMMYYIDRKACLNSQK